MCCILTTHCAACRTSAQVAAAQGQEGALDKVVGDGRHRQHSGQQQGAGGQGVRHGAGAGGQGRQPGVVGRDHEVVQHIGGKAHGPQGRERAVDALAQRLRARPARAQVDPDEDGP